MKGSKRNSRSHFTLLASRFVFNVMFDSRFVFVVRCSTLAPRFRARLRNSPAEPEREHEPRSEK